MRLLNRILLVLNGPEFIPNIVSNVIAGLVLLALPLTCAVLSGKFSDKLPEETWRNKVWTERNSEAVKFYGATKSPNRVDITGMDEGPLKIEIVSESESDLTGVLKCLDHGKRVGQCVVKFLPKNEIRVTATGDGNYGFELTFVIVSKDS